MQSVEIEKMKAELEELRSDRDRMFQRIKELEVFAVTPASTLKDMIEKWLKEHPCERIEHGGGRLSESKIVSEKELTAYLDEGWDLVRELSNGKIVIRRPLEV